MAVCHDTYAIRRWKASYYWQENKLKRWIYGDILLTHEGLRCVFPKDEKVKDSYDMDFTFRFEEITQMMKAKSMFVYDSLVIIKSDAKQHWISSLQNRDAVFNIVEHFWKDRLIPELDKEQRKKRDSGQTKLGQAFLQSLRDSDATLTHAASQLYHQGSQLENADRLMYDLHDDLDVAENLVSGLESWVGRWSVPGLKYTPELPEMVQRNDVSSFTEVPVLFTSHKRPSDFLARRGLCRVTIEGVTIMDEKQALIQHYNPREVSMIRVISPWEMIISHYMIGSPDVAYTLVSVQMVELLKALEPTYRRKIQYDNPPTEIDAERLAERCTESRRSSRSSKRNSFISELSTSLDFSGSSHFASTTQAQKLQPQRSSQVMSVEEAEEISDIMTRMKSMASDIGVEQDRQMNRIDSLTEKVDTANVRLKEDNFRINKLL